MWAYARVNPCVCMCVTFPSVYDCTQTDFVLPVLSYFSEESSPVIPDSKAPAVAQPVPTRLTSCFPYWTLSLSDSWANRERDPRTMSTAQYSFRRDFFWRNKKKHLLFECYKILNTNFKIILKFNRLKKLIRALSNGDHLIRKPREEGAQEHFKSYSWRLTHSMLHCKNTIKNKNKTNSCKSLVSSSVQERLLHDCWVGSWGLCLTMPPGTLAMRMFPSWTPVLPPGNDPHTSRGNGLQLYSPTTISLFSFMVPCEEDA